MSEQPRAQRIPLDKDLSALIDAYAQGVHLRAMNVLRDQDAAKRVIQAVFRDAARESRRAQGGFNAAAFIAYATEKAIYAERYGESERAPASGETLFSDAAAEAMSFSAPEAPVRIEAPEPDAPPPPPAYEPPAPRAYEPPAVPANEPSAAAEPMRTEPARADSTRIKAPLPPNAYDAPEDVLQRAKQRLGREDAATPSAIRPEPPVSPARTAPKARTRRRPKGRSHRGNGLLIALVLVAFLVLLWLLCGILMDMGALPRLDLGYTFFNARLFPLFRTF